MKNWTRIKTGHLKLGHRTNEAGGANRAALKAHFLQVGKGASVLGERLGYAHRYSQGDVSTVK